VLGVRPARAGPALAGLMLMGSLVAALRLRPESSTAQTIAFDRALSGRLGHAAWTLALDFDRDGQINVPGGGDCAPFDARRGLPYRPTVVLVTIDALGAPRLKALGSPTSLMPHLDELATRSMLFTHAFSQGPSTRLSFPSMFTSHWDSELVFLYAPTHSVFDLGERKTDPGRARRCGVRDRRGHP
jgi:hypothetical protein